MMVVNTSTLPKLPARLLPVVILVLLNGLHVAHTVSAKNASLALTPAMGWNSWNHFHCDVSEELIKATVDAMVSTGLRDLGYIYGKLLCLF